MVLRLRENWQDFVTEKETEMRNKIVNKANATGRLSDREGQILVDYDKKTRVCNTCGKTFKEAGMWINATFTNNKGEEVESGLFANCFQCEMLRCFAEWDKLEN